MKPAPVWQFIPIEKPVPPIINMVAYGFWRISGRECEIYLQARPVHCDRGNWLAQIAPYGQLERDMDGTDGWPRYYFDLDRAKLEIEAWLDKRGQRLPK